MVSWARLYPWVPSPRSWIRGTLRSGAQFPVRGERIDARISPRTGVVVDSKGGLDRPERRQGGDVAHHR